MKGLLSKYGATVVIVLWAVFCWCFFQFLYPYHFFYHEQNQIFLWDWEYVSDYFDKTGGVARLVGDFLTQFYYYLYAGATILTLCIAVTGTLFYKALRNFRVCRQIALVLALVVMTFVAICHFSTNYRLSSTISVAGWMLVLWLVSLIQDFALEKTFAVVNEYQFGNYDKVINIVKSSDGWNDQMLFFYNLVQAQRGSLPDHLQDFTPNNLGTFDKIGPKSPRLTINNMNELYWALGDMTFTERAAMMTNVFAPENRQCRSAEIPANSRKDLRLPSMGRCDTGIVIKGTDAAVSGTEDQVRKPS